MINDPIAHFLGEWSVSLNLYSIFLRLAVSLLLGAVIGWERSSKRHSAGLRTFIMVSLTSTIIMMLDIFITKNFGVKIFLFSAISIISVARIATRTLYFSSRNQITGLTTSFALWATSILGLGLGIGFYTVTLCAFI